MNKACLLLGSNEGDRVATMRRAINLLEAAGVYVVLQSRYYQTAAWGLTEQPDFLNMALLAETELSATGLLQVIGRVEKELGRQREVKWGQRTLDIDIIFFNDDIIHLPALTIPHPYMQDRRFVLVPMHEIVPGWVHPLLHKTVAQLLEVCSDILQVSVYNYEI